MIQSLLRHDLTQAQHDGLLAVIIIVLALAVGHRRCIASCSEF